MPCHIYQTHGNQSVFVVWIKKYKTKFETVERIYKSFLVHPSINDHRSLVWEILKKY
jgi:hypothetical protein